MCESLTKSKLKELMRRAKKEYERLGLYDGDRLEVFDEEFMEINILNWSLKGYIK